MIVGCVIVCGGSPDYIHVYTCSAEDVEVLGVVVYIKRYWLHTVQ